jgi:hypothetical protein
MMEGPVALLSFFVGFALLLGPISYNGQDYTHNYKYPDLPPPPHDRPPPLDEDGGQPGNPSPAFASRFFHSSFFLFYIII